MDFSHSREMIVWWAISLLFKNKKNDLIIILKKYYGTIWEKIRRRIDGCHPL